MNKRELIQYAVEHQIDKGNDEIFPQWKENQPFMEDLSLRLKWQVLY